MREPSVMPIGLDHGLRTGRLENGRGGGGCGGGALGSGGAVAAIGGGSVISVSL